MIKVFSIHLSINILKMYIKTIILILLSLFLSSNSWGQSVQDMLNKGVTSYDNKNKITVNDSEKFKELLISENYRDFFGAIADLKNKNKEEYEKVLLSQRDMGHVPVYWLLADLYAGGNEKEQELSKKFLYIALIMTQQDSSLCVDQTAKYATSNLLNYFKQTAEIAKKDNKNNAGINHDQ